MMQADDSLSTRLTYGVKGPHTISREVEGEGWTAALPPPTSTPAVARTVGNDYLVREDPRCREGRLRQSLTMILRGAQ